MGNTVRIRTQMPCPNCRVLSVGSGAKSSRGLYGSRPGMGYSFRGPIQFEEGGLPGGGLKVNDGNVVAG